MILFSAFDKVREQGAAVAVHQGFPVNDYNDDDDDDDDDDNNNDNNNNNNNSIMCASREQLSLSLKGFLSMTIIIIIINIII